MDLSIWSFTPLVAAPVAAILLVAVLRQLLHLPASASAVDREAQFTAPETGHSAPNSVSAQDAIDAHWNPLVTQVLPIFVGAAIIFLAAWPFAYVGWMLTHTAGDPEIANLSPPWFGNPGYLLGLGLIGVMCSLAIAFIAGIAFLALYLLGRCAIWPQMCAGGSDEQDQEAACHDDAS